MGSREGMIRRGVGNCPRGSGCSRDIWTMLGDGSSW